MGTRSLTYIYETPEFAENVNKLKPITCIYKHWDGYPSGIGKQIKDCLQGGVIVNGFSSSDKRPKQINGMGDLAAMLIWYLKGGTNACEQGDVSIMTPELDKDAWQDYEYHIRATLDGVICITIKEPDEEIYRGSIDDFDPESVELLEE